MKKVSMYRVTCDHLGCEEYFNYGVEVDQGASDQGWMIVYTEEPWDACDCKCYCPKHKHRSVIPDARCRVVGTPFDVVLAEDRMLPDGTIPVKVLPYTGDPPKVVNLPHSGEPPVVVKLPYTGPPYDNMGRRAEEL